MKSLSLVSSGGKKVSPESRLISRLLFNSPLRSSSESGSRISTLERSCTSSSSGIIFLSPSTCPLPFYLLWQEHLHLSAEKAIHYLLSVAQLSVKFLTSLSISQVKHQVRYRVR